MRITIGKTVAMILVLVVGDAVWARPPDQFEPRRKGPFTPHELQILQHVKGKICERQLPNDILISQPDFVVFVPEQSIFRDKIDLSKPSDTFNDHFHVFYDESRKLMYAFWTQSCTEAGPDQHVSFAKSSDKGRTWTKPVILVGGEYKARPHLQSSWQQPMLSKSGRLYLLWNQQVTSYGGGLGDMFGMYSDDAGETWVNIRKVPFPYRSEMDPKDPSEPPVWFNWQRPLRLGEGGKYFVGCSRDGQAPYDPHRCTRVEFWQFENIDENPEPDKIRITCLNPNKAALGTEDIDEPNLKLFHVGDKTRWQTVAEAAPVKLPDGRLFTLCRSSVGYPLWSVSSDGGRTWSKLKALRDRHGKPFLHPTSPCPLYDWKGCEAGSGYYIAFVHNTFDFNADKSYQPRGPLYLLAGRYAPNAEQPILFDDPQLFTPREEANSFYASYTYVDGEGILWYNDQKYYLLGRKIGPEWFRNLTQDSSVDTYMAGAGREKGVAQKTVTPYTIEKRPTFDPVKAGWRKIFEDEFDGDAIDWTKWFGPYYDPVKRQFAATDGQGHLRIAIRMKPGTTNVLESTSLYTSQAFGYGYFEARLKFSEKPGWWAAFWGYGDVNTNPFLDGFEPDGFEDFYTRRKVWRKRGDAILAHNLHVRSGFGRSKSFSYLSRLPDAVDRWYDFGMLRTPFEISYYLDGKLIKEYRLDDGGNPIKEPRTNDPRHPHDSVTFDAFTSAACTAPMHAVLSACIMDPVWGGDLAELDGVTFPDYFEVDRVRIYAMPDDAGTRPDVVWQKGTLPVETVSTGSVVRLSVDATVCGGQKPKAVYLFDNGYFLACRTNAPYAFEVPLTEAYFNGTAYMRRGGEGKKPAFNGFPHVFHVFAQDASGRVGRTAEPVIRIPRFGGSTPYAGKPQAIPGAVSPAHFDAGGVPFGYYKHEETVLKPRFDLNPRPSHAFRPKDHASCSAAGDAIDFVATGEWMNYTVEIAKGATYDVTFPYGTPGRGINRLDFLVDGRFVASVTLEGHDDAGFARDRKAKLRLPLPKGRHLLTILPIGPLSFGTLEFK